MENLSEDESLPNYNYPPQYNLHGLIDITALQHYQPDVQSHLSLHNPSLHPSNELQANHLTDYTNQAYGSLGHSTGYTDGQSTAVYPTTLSPVSEQINSSLNNSWPATAVNKNAIGRWTEARNQAHQRVEVGGIGWTDQLNKSMHRLMEVDMVCDTVIVTNTNQIKVHKLILMSSSDYLLTLLKRYDNLKMLQLQIPINITMEALKTFATFLYLGKADLTSENIHDVAILANIFNIQVLKDLIVKLSGNPTIMDDGISFELQPMVLDFYDKRDQYVDTSTLVVTTEQGINTDSCLSNSIQMPPNVFADVIHEDGSNSDKKIPKRNTMTQNTSHTYGTRSTVAPKGTPKSRRKIYIEEISKKDLESKMNGATVDNISTGMGSVTKEVYRGKKSRLLAGTLKQEATDSQTPATRGKAKRKLELVNVTGSQTEDSHVVTFTDNTLTDQIEHKIDVNFATKRGGFRKIGTGSQVTVRPPPKKRAKMELQLSEEQLVDEFDDEGDEPVEQMKNVENVEPTSEKPKNKNTLKKEPGLRSKRKRNGRWKQSTNMVGIANDVESLAEHIPEIDRQFKCNLCGNEFVFSKRCISHMVKTHAIEETDVIPNIIIRNKSESDPKICDICGYKTKDQNFCYIHYHKYFKHGIPLPRGWVVYKCDECGKECFTKFMLKDHKLTHREQTPFICETCGQGFKSRTCLNSHVFHRHKEVRKHNCPSCKKTFKTKTQMSVHMRTHTGEKPFNCPECDYKSTTRGNMRLHLANKHKLDTVDVKNIMSKIDVIPLLETDAAGDIAAVPLQLITVENAEIKASVHIDNQMNWTTINEVTDQKNFNTVTPTILLPSAQSDQSIPYSYTTYTIVPSSSSNVVEIQSAPVDLLAPTSNRNICNLKTVPISSVSQPSSSQLYLQHSPISPAPAIPPDGHFKASHNIINSPITPPPPNSPYPSATNLVNSPISPVVTNSSYTAYVQNLSNSPISPSQPPMSPNQSYQTISNVSVPVNLQISQSVPQDNGNVTYTDVSQLQVDSSYNSQHYDSSLLQVYYQQQNFYSSV